MCTSLVFTGQTPYFGRNLDLEYDFGQQVVITPRAFPLTFKKMPALERHYALIGMATVAAGWPLYAEAMNEKGLYLAGLNFPNSARYPCGPENGIPAGPYELIPWLLGTCDTVDQAVERLSRVRLIDLPFLPDMPCAPLHWHLADGRRAVVAEPTAEGLRLYDDPVGVLTNEPPFPFHQANLRQYMGLSSANPEDRLGAPGLSPFGQGIGALGLPGDSSPPSRYVRAAFHRWNSACPEGEGAAVSQFFHILDTVAMVRGAVRTPEGKWDITRYACCASPAAGAYYYKTYDGGGIMGVDFSHARQEGDALICLPLEPAAPPRLL